MSVERLNQGVALQKAGRHREARKIYVEVLKEDPHNVNALQLFATTELAANRLDAAKDILLHILKARPDHAVVHHNLAYVYGSLGDIDAAMSHYRDAVRLQPNYAEAYFNLVNTIKISPDDPVIAAVEAQLKRTGLNDDDLGFLHFAAGKIYDDTGDYDRAFGHYLEGNSVAGRPFDAAKNAAALQNVTKTVTAELIATLQVHGNASDKPVFVVGMPRSGTTLVEQILSGHPAVFGAGELGDVFAMVRQIGKHSASSATYPAALLDVVPGAIEGYAKTYVERITKLGGDATRVVDKQPLNLLHLGFISMLLPNARIIRCRRDPIDTCLSCFFQKFRTGNAFSFDLHDVGAFHRGVETLAEHWRRVVPNAYMEVIYEDLVEEPERIAREMIDFCGLDWDGRCLDIEKRDRPILTASRSQARQPIYRSSVRKWHRYRDHLGPLIEALGPLAET